MSYCNCPPTSCCPPKSSDCTWSTFKKYIRCIYDGLKDRFFDGVTSYLLIGLDNVGAVVNSKGTYVEDYEIFNNTTGILYVKLYNKASLATITDVPVKVLMIPAESGANLAQLRIPFTVGLSIRATVGVLNNDNTAPAADSLVVNIGYRDI